MRISLTESDLHRIVKESVNRILNGRLQSITEAFASNKLAQMVQQHGGIKQSSNGPWSYVNGDELPLSVVTDDMIGNEVVQLRMGDQRQQNSITFKDGTSVLVVNPKSAMAAKRNSESNQTNGRYTGLNQGQYTPATPQQARYRWDRNYLAQTNKQQLSPQNARDVQKTRQTVRNQYAAMQRGNK